MAVVLYANNASTTLAGSVTTIATSCTLLTGTGALFPNPSAGQYFCMTFTDAATNLIREIVHVTARSGDVCTIVRAQESTTAKAWSVADNALNLWTAGSAASLAQVSQVQAQADNYAADSGTANALVITLSLAPASYTALIGAPIRVLKSASANTSSVTINVNGLGAKSITMPGIVAVTAGALPASSLFTIVYDGTEFQLQGGFSTLRTGELIMWPAPTPPPYALVRDGAAISRATYSGLNALAAAVSYVAPWGPGNGTTTFNIPNDLGQFERGWDSSSTVDPGRGFGSLQGSANLAHTHTIGYGSTDTGSAVNPDLSSNTLGSFTTDPSGGSESRPTNRAYLPCICI